MAKGVEDVEPNTRILKKRHSHASEISPKTTSKEVEPVEKEKCRKSIPQLHETSAEEKDKAPKGESRQEKKRSSKPSGFEKQSRVAFQSDDPYVLRQRADVDLEKEWEETQTSFLEQALHKIQDSNLNLRHCSPIHTKWLGPSYYRGKPRERKWGQSTQEEGAIG